MEDKEAKVKPWEKPWTTDEIRDQSARWNLAGDAGLLKTLEQFAEDLTTRSNGTLKKLNTLANDLEQTSSNISNVTNTFLLLSNKQFFENRVKDDDEAADIQKSEDKRTVDEKEKSEPGDPKERVRDALTKGMEFLDTMFSSVVLVVGSDSEEEEDSLTSAGRLLKPINPYTSRPLPCIIGSREFFQDDHVGLGAQSDEDESGELDEEESVQSSDSEADNEALPSDLLQRKKISTPSESENSQPESEQSGVPEKKKHHGDQMFGQESPPEAEVSSVPTQNTAQKSFAAELASKLSGVAAADTANPVQNSSRPPPPAAKEKPDIYAQTRKHFDDLFGPPSDDEDDSLFGSGGKYSGGRGLFDDDDDVEDWKKPPAKNLWEEPTKVSRSKEDGPRNVPALAVQNPSSLFDGEDADHSIFTSPNVSNPTRAQNEVEASNSQVTTSTPNQQGDSLSSLIDDFRNVSAIQAVPRPQHDQSGGFGNASEGLGAKDSGLQSDASGQTTFKKPAGGVSIFGNMAVNASMLAGKLQSSSSKEVTPANAAIVGRSTSGSTSGVGSDTVSKSSKSSSGNSSAVPQARETPPQAPKTNDEDDDADNLFRSGTANAQSSQRNSTGKSSTTAPTTKKSLSLFDDLDSEDDDLLFSSTGSTGSRSRQSVDVLDRKSQFPIMPKKNIFDDEDLFGGDVGGGDDFDIFGSKPEAGKSKVGIDAVPDKSGKSLLKGDSLAGSLEVGGGSGFDLFGSKVEAGKNTVSVNTAPDKSNKAVTKGDSLASSLGKGSNPLAPSSESSGEKNRKDSKLDDLSWLDDAETGDIFSDLNTKVEQPPTCKEPTLHSDLFSDKLFEDVDEDSSLHSIITPKPRGNTAVAKDEPSALEPAKLPENYAEVPKPVAVARTAAAPKTVQETPVPNERPDRGQKPTVAPRKTGTASAGKLETEKSGGGRESTGLFEESADLSLPESKLNRAKHILSSQESDEDDLFKNDPVTPAVKPLVKPEPPKTLNIRQTADLGTSLGDDLFNDGPPRDSVAAIVPPVAVSTLPATVKPVLGKDTTDGSALRGPTDLRSNKEALAANVVEKNDAPSEPLRPSPKLKLNIDPLALLPGAKPPTRAERLEKAATFDGPAPDSVATLPSAGKDRVKIQVKRRPQTRRARQEAIRASLIENEDGSFGGDEVPGAASETSPPVAQEVSTTVAAAAAPPPTKTSLLVTEPEDGPDNPLPNLPQERSSNPKLLLPSSNPLSPSTDEEDFFGVPPDLPSDYGNPRDCNGTGNLFGDAPVLSPLDLGSVKTFTEKSGDLFATTGQGEDGDKTVPAGSPLLFDSTKNGNLDSQPDPPAEETFGDLFGQKVSSKTLQDLFPTVKKESVVKSREDENSLFRGVNSVAKNHSPSLFSGSDEEDEDLFSLQKPGRREAGKAKEGKPAAPSLLADPSSKSSNGLPKANPPKGADSKAPSGGGPGGIFTSALPPEEKLFPNDRDGAQPVHSKKATKVAAPAVTSNNVDDDDSLFSSSSAIFASSKGSHGGKKGGGGGSSSLFGDDSPESEDLFGGVSSSSISSKKVPPTTKVAESKTVAQPVKPVNRMQKSIFDDDDDAEDIFSKPSSKSSSSSNISQSILGTLADPYDLFANVPSSKTAPGKAQKQQGGGSSSRVKVNEKGDVFEDPLMALKK